MPRNARRKPPSMMNPSVPSAPLEVTGLGYGQNAPVNAARQSIPAAGPTAAGLPADAMAAATGYSPNVTSLGAPTENPDEPVTAGLDMGAGAGSDSMRPMVAEEPPDPDLAGLAVYLPMLERLASQPTASVATRNLVRRLRGAQVNAG